MSKFLPFFILIILATSATAEIISINSPRGSQDINSPLTPADIDNEATPIQRITITSQPGTTPQVFSPVTDPNINANTQGTVTFRRVNTLQRQTPPPISQFYFLNTVAPVNEPASTPTGAITLPGETPANSAVVAFVIIISFVLLLFVFHHTPELHSKLLIASVVLFLATLLSIKLLATQGTPTTLAIYEASGPGAGIQTHVNNPFALTWTGGGPVTYLGGSTTDQCSDGLDNDGDSLVDCEDPGCHSDGNPNNAGSCVPDDGLEKDILEYDHPPVVDNQIDVYDVVNWVQYFQNDTTVLIHCTDATCSNQIGSANCVGDTDPSNDGLLTAADMTTLQTAEINDQDSRTQGICFNPS